MNSVNFPKTNVSKVCSIIMCGFLTLLLPLSMASATGKKAMTEPAVLTGGVKGEATLKPSVKVIQPEEKRVGDDHAGRTGTNRRHSQSYDWGIEPEDYSAAQYKDPLKRNRKLERQKKKREQRQSQGHWHHMQPVSSYQYKRHKGTVSTPGNTFTMDSTERADLLWIKSLAKGILKEDRSYIPRFADPDAALKREKRRLKQEQRRKMRGYSVYSKKRQQFMSPGYSLSYSYGKLKESSLGGRWYVPDQKLPVPLIARAGRLTDPVFAQPVIFQPAGTEAALTASPDSIGLIWSDWYKEMARAIYDNWEQTEIGPGLARVRITVNKEKQIGARIVDFKPAPYVSRDPSSEIAFRQAALHAVQKLKLNEIPPYPISGKNKVVFDVEMRRLVEGPGGIEILMSDEDQIDQIMTMVDQLSPHEQQAVFKKFTR